MSASYGRCTESSSESRPDAGNEAEALALSCRGAGISTIPVRCDGSKAPALSTWDPFKTRLPSEEEIHSWFGNGHRNGVAVVGGGVSGHLGVLDFEFPDFYRDWAELVEAECPGLAESLPLVQTPGKSAEGGRHCYFRSPVPVPTGKLARLTADEARQRTGDPGKRTAIEVKAEGGYVLAPGCPAECHESGRLYRHISGPFIDEVLTLTEEQVSVLRNAARALDHAPGPKVEDYHGADVEAGPGEAGGRPGDVFNRAADWRMLLEPHGWTLVRAKGGVAYWRRPGKDKGISATTGFCRSETAGDLLCVFSTNADPLTIPDGRDHRCFSRFTAHALLNFGGDFQKAAKALWVLGWLHRQGVRFASLRKLGGKGGGYEMRLEGGQTVDFSGIGQLTDQYRFRMQVADSLQLFLTPVNKKHWFLACKCLLSLTRVEDLGTDDVQVLHGWVMRYMLHNRWQWHGLDAEDGPDDKSTNLATRAARGDRDAIVSTLMGGHPAWVPGQAVYLDLGRFQQWLVDQKVSWIDQKDLGARLRKARCVRERLSQPRKAAGTGPRSQPYGWKIPDQWRLDFEDLMRIGRREP
jgi:putative DNA primase/helicase